MMSRKLSEHVEEELFDKEKRVKYMKPGASYTENELGNPPKITKESVLGLSEDKPVKKKKPYYRKKYNKPKPIEDVDSKSYKNIKVEPVKVLVEPVNQHLFIKGLLVGSVLTAIICHIIYSI